MPGPPAAAREVEPMNRDHDDLSRSMPQVSHRARAYKLEDNGASDAAHLRRRHKEGIGAARTMIRDLNRRQAGQSGWPPLDPDDAEEALRRWQERIDMLKQKLQDERPSVRIIAPVARRVAREDRRRRRAELKHKEQGA